MRKSFQLLLAAMALGLILSACGRKPLHVTQIETSFLTVDSTLDAIQDTAYLAELAPQKARIEELSSVVIGHVPEQMDAYTPESPLLNWAADALFFPIRAQRGEEVDFGIVNVGGLRCSWSAGDLTIRSVFELMPFENEVVILSLRGKDVLLLADQIAAQGGQGVSGMTLVIADGKATDVRVQGKNVDPERIYHVVTSDYLSGGADGMDALHNYEAREMTGIVIREQYIDYAKTLTQNGQPIKAACDGRITINN